MSFTKVDTRYDGPALEQGILEFWRDQTVFEKSLQHSAGTVSYTHLTLPTKRIV